MGNNGPYALLGSPNQQGYRGPQQYDQQGYGGYGNGYRPHEGSHGHHHHRQHHHHRDEFDRDFDRGSEGYGGGYDRHYD